MPLLAELLDADNAEGRRFLHGAFMVALDDFAAHGSEPPNVDRSVVVAAALAVMSRIDPERIDPVRLVDHDRAEVARTLVARCAAYAPLFAARAPWLSPWFDALGGAGSQCEAAVGGDPADGFDVEWLGKLAPAVFRFAATRKYLARYLDAVLATVASDADPSGALWLCLRFRRWFSPSEQQRARLGAEVERCRRSSRRATMLVALRKLDAASARPAGE
jgi:hypothetical protein